MIDPNQEKIEAIKKIVDMAKKAHEDENKILITLSIGAIGFLSHRLLNFKYNIFLLIAFISFCMCLIILISYYWLMRFFSIKTLKSVAKSDWSFDQEKFKNDIEEKINNVAQVEFEK